MKKLLVISIISVILAACGPQYPSNQGWDQDYQVITGPTGQQMVVYNNNGNQMLMDYILFTSLMNSGGYGNVRNYYVSHPSSFVPYSSNYRSWRRGSVSGRSYYRNYQSRSNSGLRSNTPSTGTGFRNLDRSSGYKSSNSGLRSTTPSTGRGFKSTSSGRRSSSGLRGRH